jgi:hypothetical protein
MRAELNDRAVRFGRAVAEPRAVCRLAAVALFAGLALLPATQAHAKKDSCAHCKYARCLRDVIQQKQQLIAVYQGLYEFWKNRSTGDDEMPLLVQDLGDRAEPERSQVYRATLKQLDQYREMEDHRTSDVARPESCGFPADEDLEVKTDSFEKCDTDQAQLNAAKQSVPCQELADLIEKHENVHRDACKKRKSAQYWNYVVEGADGSRVGRFLPKYLLTPAGKAKEEIDAYSMEVDALQAILNKIANKCWGSDQGPIEKAPCKGLGCYFNPGSR